MDGLKSIAVLAAVACVGISGCVVAPVGADGRPYAIYPIPPSPAVVGSAATAAVSTGARLYPANDVASQWGVLSGTVTNLLSGRGEFQLSFAGEHLVGEATRNPGDARRGVASAFGSRGTSMQCQYQMNSTTVGTGTCNLSNGARYTLHIGS